jgi:hypothetical protein
MPLHRTFPEDPRLRAIKETAAIFVASGHGLIEVKIPSQNAETISR